MRFSEDLNNSGGDTKNQQEYELRAASRGYMGKDGTQMMEDKCHRDRSKQQRGAEMKPSEGMLFIRGQQKLSL